MHTDIGHDSIPLRISVYIYIYIYTYLYVYTRIYIHIYEGANDACLESY